MQLALDGGDNLTYIAPTMVNLNLTQNVTLTFSSAKRANTNRLPGHGIRRACNFLSFKSLAECS